jgi:hypothetical protein
MPEFRVLRTRRVLFGLLLSVIYQLLTNQRCCYFPVPFVNFN